MTKKELDKINDTIKIVDIKELSTEVKEEEPKADLFHSMMEYDPDNDKQMKILNGLLIFMLVVVFVLLGLFFYFVYLLLN